MEANLGDGGGGSGGSREASVADDGAGAGGVDASAASASFSAAVSSSAAAASSTSSAAALSAASSSAASAGASAAAAAASNPSLRATLATLLVLLFLASEESAAGNVAFGGPSHPRSTLHGGGGAGASAGGSGGGGSGGGSGGGGSGGGSSGSGGGGGGAMPPGDCLFFAAGTSFRSKPSAGVSAIGSVESAPLQDLAIASQLAFLDELEARHGLRCDISLSTFSGSADLDSRLLEAYSATGLTITRFEATPRQVSLSEMFLSAFSPALEGGGAAKFGEPARVANDSAAQRYRFALYMRVDVLLRPFFTELFDPAWNQTRFSSIEWFDPPGGWDRNFVGSFVGNTRDPRIADMLMFVPRALFATVPLGSIAHEAWHGLLSRGVPRSAGNVMVHTFHDADTAKDWNPLYELANRPNIEVWHNAGYYWPEGGDFLTPVFDPRLQDHSAFDSGVYATIIKEAASAGGRGGLPGRMLQPSNTSAASSAVCAGCERRRKGPLERLHAEMLDLSDDALSRFCSKTELPHLLLRPEAAGGYGLRPQHLPLFAKRSLLR